jgi:hypothetical protein
MNNTEAETNGQNYTGRLILHSSTDLGLCTLPCSKLLGRTIGMLQELQSIFRTLAAASGLATLRRAARWVLSFGRCTLST